MNFGSKGFYLAIFLLVFLMMLIIGVNSGVSLPASLNRAIFAGGLFAMLTWVTGKVISTYVFLPSPTVFMSENETSESPTGENGTVGTNIDVTATDPVMHNEQQTTEPSGGEFNSSDAFTPMTAKQIDPQVNKIINSDPRKMAEIVRKMGFEEE